MNSISISYTDLKTKATELNQLYHYIDFGTQSYGVFIFDPTTERLYDASVLKDSGANQTDFETNIKPTATSHASYSKLFEVLGALVGDAPERIVRGFRKHKTRYWRRSFNYLAPAGTATNFDVPILEDIWLSGGAYKVDGNAVWGDRLEFIVIDIDGVIGPPGTILTRYVDDEYVFPGAAEREITTGGATKILTGLYLRVRYISTGGTPVKFVVRHFMRRM